MGMDFKTHAKGKNNKAEYFSLSFWGFGSMREFSKVIDGDGSLEQFFTHCPAKWGGEDTKTVAEALSRVTLKQVAAFKKICRDNAVASPIETCVRCEGEGTTEIDDNGLPQYKSFCKPCHGLGVTRNTYDVGDYIDLDTIHHLAEFLKTSGGVSIS